MSRHALLVANALLLHYSSFTPALLSYIHICIHILLLCFNIYMHIHMLYSCMLTPKCISIYTYILIYIHIYIYIYTYIYIHIHIHIHILYSCFASRYICNFCNPAFLKYLYLCSCFTPPVLLLLLLCVCVCV